MADGPLRGVRVLDLTHVWAGPLATRILADLGAEVVRIEAPAGRGHGVYPIEEVVGGWIGGSPGDEPWNRVAAAVKLQRNKRSVAIDLKTEPGRAIFLELAALADVVIENFSVHAMPGLGLGYAALSAVNPRILYMAMPGFGTDGPYRDRVAFGPTVEAMSGMAEVFGYGPEEPRNTATAFMDPVAALNAAGAVLSALRDRQRTGRGAFIEMALYESGVAFCGPWLIAHQLHQKGHPPQDQRGHPPSTGTPTEHRQGHPPSTGTPTEHEDQRGHPPSTGASTEHQKGHPPPHRQGHPPPHQKGHPPSTGTHTEHQKGHPPQRIGNRHPAMAPHGVYACRGENAWVAIACRNDSDWGGLCSVIGGNLEANANLWERRAQSDVIDAAISAWTTGRAKEEAASLLQAAGVPAGPVNTTPEMVADPQVRARGFFVPLEPGPTPMPGNPVKMAGIGSGDWTPSARLGADNAAILRDWLGYDAQRIAELERRGVLADKPPA